MRLVNLRNDYVHANLVKSSETYLIEEDGKTFWIESEDSSEIPTNINRLSSEHVEFAKKCIDEVIELVFESMDIKSRRKFERIIFESEIEVENIDGILIPI